MVTVAMIQSSLVSAPLGWWRSVILEHIKTWHEKSIRASLSPEAVFHDQAECEIGREWQSSGRCSNRILYALW
jgi:hypothetical protein